MMRFRFSGTPSEQRKNLEAIVDEMPRGHGRAAAKGRDDHGRGQLVDAMFNEIDGARLRPAPLDHSHIRDLVRIALRNERQWKQEAGGKQ